MIGLILDCHVTLPPMILLLLGTKSGLSVRRMRRDIENTTYSVYYNVQAVTFIPKKNKSINVASIYASEINGIMEAWTLGSLERKSIWFTHY